jgi:hypothetical protein
VGPAVFKTAPFDRSGTPPRCLFKPIHGFALLELVGLRNAPRNARAVERLERVVEEVLREGGGDLRARVPELPSDDGPRLPGGQHDRRGGVPVLMTQPRLWR